MKSDVVAQKNRPPMLNRLNRPTKAPAVAAFTEENISWIMGEAVPSTPIPAVMFMHSTPHSSQNCGVFHATSTETFAALIILLAVALGTQPAGFQSGDGTRMLNTPIIMKMK